MADFRVSEWHITNDLLYIASNEDGNFITRFSDVTTIQEWASKVTLTFSNGHQVTFALLIREGGESAASDFVADLYQRMRGATCTVGWRR